MCMQAVDFLHDAKTVAAIESRLLLAILGNYEDARHRMTAPPSAAACARAYRVRPPACACAARMPGKLKHLALPVSVHPC